MNKIHQFSEIYGKIRKGERKQDQEIKANNHLIRSLFKPIRGGLIPGDLKGVSNTLNTHAEGD